MLDPAQNTNHSSDNVKAQTPVGQKAANPLLAKLRNTITASPTQSKPVIRQQQPSIAAAPSIAKIQTVVKTKPTAKIQSTAALLPSAVSTQTQLNKKNNYFSTSEQLDVLDQVITQATQAVPVNEAPAVTPEVPVSPPLSKMKIVKPTVQTTPLLQSNPQGIMGQGLAAAVDNATQSTLNPSTPTRSAKEAAEATGVDNSQVIEAARGAQAVEVEPTPEISPEVEAYVRKVQDDTQTPQEIVIADSIDAIPDTSKLQKRPVIILPITPEIEKKARFKGPKFSVRWLVEWSKKMMKMFFGKVIYRQEEVRE